MCATATTPASVYASARERPWATFSTTARTSARPAFAPRALGAVLHAPSIRTARPRPRAERARAVPGGRTIVGPRDVPSPLFASDLSMRSARAPRALLVAEGHGGAASAAGVRRAKVESRGTWSGQPLAHLTADLLLS